MAAADRPCRPTERAFFRDVRPWGFILFARNIEDPDQVRSLGARPCAKPWTTLRRPVLIDQEGGRVARLKPPHWRERPAGRPLRRAACATIRKRPARPPISTPA